MIYEFAGIAPEINDSVFIAPDTSVIGRVKIGKNSSVWFGSVLRGDTEDIIIGEFTNIQDLTVIHADPGRPSILGNRITVGHRCIIHGCIIEDDCLIGMGTIIMNGAVIGKGSVIAAGSVILENTVIPPFSMVAGIPGKIKKELGPEYADFINAGADGYHEKAGQFIKTLKQLK